MPALANWEMPEQYPTVGHAMLARWHWEFLRRNHRYQADYGRFVRLDPQDPRARRA